MTLRMIRNNALVKPDTEEIRGLIHIPESLQRVGVMSGMLLQAKTEDKIILAALGKRILIRTGVLFEYGGEPYLLVKVDQILAVVNGDWTIKALDYNGIERCQWCKSAGEGNMLMDHAGYCIQCHRNKYGKTPESETMSVSDDEREAFGGTVEERLNKYNAKGKIYSFPGQTKRSAADVPATVKPSLYVAPKREHIQPKGEGRIISAASLKRRSPL